MEKIKILVVDDESRMRKLVRDFLVREDYEVLEAGDGEAALDIFYQEKNIEMCIRDRRCNQPDLRNDTGIFCRCSHASDAVRNIGV